MTKAIDDLSALVDAELRDLMQTRQMPLYKMMTYHLGWEDQRGDGNLPLHIQRSHGVACLAACLLAGGDVELALPAAAGVDLVDGFCQVHDDVQGGHPQRNGRDAVWWVWGPAQAINAGDGMHALARLAVFRLQERGAGAETAFRAVQLLDQAGLEACEGRFQDLESQERIDLSVDAYLEMAASKTGALFSCAMKLGGLVASAGPAAMDALGEAGTKLGLATQVHEDIRELWGSDAATEVLNKKKLLPVAYAFEKADVSVKRRLGDIYFKRVLEQDDVTALRVVLEDLGAREYSEQLLASLRAEAETALRIDGASPQAISTARELVDSLVGPDSA